MKALKLLCLIIVLCALAACGLDNTMYNARNYFKSAQAKPLNTNGRPNAQAIDEYTKCIQKCGIIISNNKKGARLDDAVFLMAKALYYKGNSAFQAKDQFENLIKGFPESPYVPESHIYIARILREINQPREAEKRLDEFIRDKQFSKYHPQALLLLADFSIKDKNYAQAQFWLDKIIREYPRTKEFREAYFLFGKNYYEQKDYVASREAFVKMRHARRIDKAMKLDADYYIALNDLYLKEYARAIDEAKRLMKTETRPDKLSTVRLLLGRILMASGKYEQAQEELEAVTKNYPRTEAAAAAYYFLGEYCYYQKSDIATAITNYNRVRTEFSASEYATLGQNKATALNNVKWDTSIKSETGIEQFLNYHYLAAESFTNTLALADSAVARYRRVIDEKDSLEVLRDSLLTAMAMQQASLDSLEAIVIDSLASSSVDSLKIAGDTLRVEPALAQATEIPAELAAADTLLTYQTAAGDSLLASEPAKPDSLLASTAGVLDSLQAIPDSTALIVDQQETPKLTVDLGQQKEQLRTSIAALETRIGKIDELLIRFDSEIIPFCHFAIGSLRHSIDPEHEESKLTLSILQEEYPMNKYTKAYKALLAGQPVRLIDPVVEAEEALLDSLLGLIVVQPDSALAGLERLRESPVPEIKLAANYRLGWYYSYEAPDTTAAKTYLQEVLAADTAGEYGSSVRNFFDGEKYLIWGAEVFKDSIEVISDSVMVASPDSLADVFLDSFAPADSLNYLPTELDSLNQLYMIPAADSLSDSLKVDTAEPENTRLPDAPELKPEENVPEANPGAIKEEEPSLE